MMDDIFDKFMSSFVFIILAVYLVDSIQRIFGGAKALTLSHLGNGTMITDGSEQRVFSFSRQSPFIIDGYVDLNNMKSGDSVVIRQYVKIKQDGELKKYAEERYSGVQELPVVYIKPKTAMYGIMVTLQQTSGSPFEFDWEFNMVS